MNYTKILPLIFTFGILLIFSDCTATIPITLGIINSELPDYQYIEKEQIEEIELSSNIKIYLADGDSLIGTYLGIKKNINNIETERLLLKHDGKRTFIPINNINEINLKTRKENVFIGVLLGMTIDAVILYELYSAAFEDSNFGIW